jgi:hypothetical protein
MRVLRRGVLRALAGGLVPALAAGMVLLSAGAAAAAPGSPGAPGPAPASASLSASQVKQLEAMAAAPSAVRLGWFIPVNCKCSFADEAAFQKIMNGIFGVAAALNKMSYRATFNAAMRVKPTTPKRYEDIYYFRLNKAHPAKGLGSINEFKVGTTALGSLGFQSGTDAALLKQGHGIGANTATKGEFLPVKQAVWWFAPRGGVTYHDFTFIQSLLARGINVVYMVDNPRAPAWPRTESKNRKAKDIKEIETNSQVSALSGLDNLIGPCLMICPVG